MISTIESVSYKVLSVFKFRVKAQKEDHFLTRDKFLK